MSRLCNNNNNNNKKTKHLFSLREMENKKTSKVVIIPKKFKLGTVSNLEQ